MIRRLRALPALAAVVGVVLLAPPAPAGAHAVAAASPAQVDEKALTKKLRAYLAKRPGSATVAFRDLTTGQSYTYRPGTHVITASIVKVDILAALLLKHQKDGTKLTAEERSLASRMIRKSDNAAAYTLYQHLGGPKALVSANRRLGMTATTPDTHWGRTSTTAADQVRLLRAITGEESVLKKPARTYLLHLMNTVLETQRWGVAVAADKKAPAAVKDGWLPFRDDDGLWTINSIGRIRVEGHLVAIAVLSRRSPTMKKGITTVEHVAELVGEAIRSA